MSADERYSGITAFYHLVLTYDATNIRGYVDNVLVTGPTAASGSGTAAETSAIKILCGQRGDGSTSANFASAIIDDFVIFDRALNTTEIDIIYNAAPTVAGRDDYAYLMSHIFLAMVLGSFVLRLI